MKSDNKDKLRACSEKIRERAGALMVNHPMTVAGIAVGIYALGYYKGRSQASSLVIKLCTK